MWWRALKLQVSGALLMLLLSSSLPTLEGLGFQLCSPWRERYNTLAVFVEGIIAKQSKENLFVVVQLFSCVWLFATPWIAAHQASLSITNSQSLLNLMSIESVMPSNHLSLCRPVLLLPLIFPSIIRVFSNEAGLPIRQPKDWSFSFSISPSNEYSDWFPLRMTGLISLQSKGLSRVLSNTTIQKHQPFGTQSSLWSNSYIHSWLLEKPWLWL